MRLLLLATATIALLSPTAARGGCESDAHCKGGRVCVDGACVAPASSAQPGDLPDCASDLDCPGGQRCERGACVGTPTNPAALESAPPVAMPAPVVAASAPSATPMPPAATAPTEKPAPAAYPQPPAAAGCRSDLDCKAGRTCISGECVEAAYPPPPESAPGAPECAPGQPCQPHAAQPDQSYAPVAPPVIAQTPRSCRKHRECGEGMRCAKGTCVAKPPRKQRRARGEPAAAAPQPAAGEPRPVAEPSRFALGVRAFGLAVAVPDETEVEVSGISGAGVEATLRLVAGLNLALGLGAGIAVSPNRSTTYTVELRDRLVPLVLPSVGLRYVFLRERTFRPLLGVGLGALLSESDPVVGATAHAGFDIGLGRRFAIGLQAELMAMANEQAPLLGGGGTLRLSFRF